MIVVSGLWSLWEMIVVRVCCFFLVLRRVVMLLIMIRVMWLFLCVLVIGCVLIFRVC